MPTQTTKYEELGISNDFMFGRIMQDPKICKPFLERILGISIHHIEYIEPQKAIDLKVDARSVRLDLYVEDGTTVYNCEMQTSKKRNLPKRSRYYQGQIDINLITRGEDYSKLKRSFVIFICTYDPFGKGAYVYSFRNRCEEFPDLELGDEAEKIFLSTVGENGSGSGLSEELKELLAYIGSSKLPDQCKDPLLCDMDSALTAARTNQEWRNDFMTLELLKNECREEGRQEGIQEGKQEGLMEGQFETARILLESGMEIEKVRKACPRLSVEQLKKLQAELSYQPV